MPPRRKGAGKMNAAASKRAGKQQAASSPRERSTTTVVFKPEDGTVDTKSKPALLQVPPSTTLAADPSPVKEKISMPNKEETYSLTDETAAGASMDINKAISPAKEFEVAPGAQRPDSDIGQTDEVQNHSQTAIKQATTVTYPDSETEDVSDREHEETTRIGQIEQPLEEVEMDIADDEENESDTLDIPFSTEKIRHTSPISARVLQNVRALKEEILNGGGNMSGIGRVASFNLGRIDNSPDDGMQEANGDVVLTGAPRKVSALSHSPRQSTGDIQGGGQRSVDSVETTTRLAEIGSSSPPAWGRGALKREPLQEEKFPGYAPEDSRAFKRPRKDSFHSASLQSGESNRWRSGQVGDDRSREQERDNVRDNERYIERSQRMDEDYQGMRTDRREGFSTQSQQSNQNISGRNLEEARTRVGLENQVDSRLRDHDSGKVQREEQRDTARDNFKPFDTERRPSGAFPIPPRPPSLAPPALQHVRENQGPPPFPPPFPPPAHYSARAPPVPPAMLASAQSLRPSPTWPPATKRQHETDSLAETGPRSSPYPSRSNAGFGRPTDAGTAPLRDEQQPPNCLPHNAPGPTERKGFQDRKTPLTAEPMNRARENWNLPTSSSLPVNPSALPSLTAANLGANARHDDFPPRSTGRPASRVSDDGRSNVSEARRLALQGPGTAGPPGQRIPPGSATLRAELEARQQARGTPRYRYVGHVDIKRGVLEAPQSSAPADVSRRLPHHRSPPGPQSARGPPLRASPSTLDRTSSHMDPYSTAEVSLRPHERERPPFHAGPDRGSSIRPTRDVISGDNKSENHRGFLVGQRDSAYGDGMSNNRQMDFPPPASTRGFDNRGPPALERSIDRRPPVMPPARQSYDDHTRKEVVPFSGARHAEPPYGAFQHDTPRNASRQEDFRDAPESSYRLRRENYRGVSPPLTRFSTSSLVEQELAAMKQKIADLERLRALELSVYGEGPSLSPPRRQLSPPRNVLSQRYVPIRDQPPPGDTRDEYLREPRRLSHTPNGQDARGNSGNIQEMQDIRNNGHHRNMHEFRGAPDESNYRPGQIEQVPSHGPRFEDRNGSRPIGGFRGQGGVSHATVSDRQSHQFMPPLDNDRNTSFTVRNGNQSIMSGAQDRGPAHFPENKGFPPRDSRNPEWDQKVNRKEDPPRGNFQTQGGGPNRPLDQRYPGASQDRPRIHANPISGLDGIPPARGHGPPARMGYQAPRGRR